MTDAQNEAIQAVKRAGTVRGAAKMLGKDPKTIRELLRRSKKLPAIRRRAETVGIIGDTHIPYERDGYLEFCCSVFEREGVTRVIHIGDLLDHHALSFHDSEPALKGAYGERLDAVERLKPWFRAFPRLTLVLGNHDHIPARQVKKAGMDPDVFLRPLAEIYEFPPGWQMVEQITIDGVIYHHGQTSSGVNGFRTDAQRRMQSTVSGHNHSNFGISWSASDHRAVWGMAVGCGVDSSAMAFAYGKHFKLKPIVGCGVVKNNGREPHVFAMDLGEK